MDEKVYLHQKSNLIMLSLKHDYYKDATIELLKTLKKSSNPDYVSFATHLLAFMKDDLHDVETYISNHQNHSE